MIIEDISPIIDNFDVKYTIIILFDELELFYIYFCVIHHLNRFSTVYNSSIIKLSLIWTFNPFFLEFMENGPKLAQNYGKCEVTWPWSRDRIITKLRIFFDNINLCFISFQMIYRFWVLESILILKNDVKLLNIMSIIGKCQNRGTARGRHFQDLILLIYYSMYSFSIY